MGRLATAYGQAVAAHRRAVQHWENARRALAAAGPVPPRNAELVARLARLGADLAAPTAGATSLSAGPVPVRIGEATTLDGGFPVLLPLAGGNHLAVDADARDPRVGELLRALILRLLAIAPAGTVRVAGIDPAAFGAAFLPLRPLLDAGVLGPTATTAAEVAALLDEAERHARTAQRAARDDQELLLLVAASAPPPRELARLAALTHAGPAAAVCVLLAGYPPTGPGNSAPPLGATIQLRLNERYALVGDPPGQPFSSDGSGLAAPVLLDGDPSAASIAALGARLGAATRRAAAVRFADLLPERRWAESAGAGLRTVLGRAGRETVTVAFDDATPHWLVGGRTGAGKTVFLLDVLYGLAARYAPADLQLYLLDFKEGVSFTEFVPTGHDPSWLPHARAVGIESDREYGVAVLRELRDELTRRAGVLKRHGVSKLADLPPNARPPRIVTVVDEFHVLFAGNDALARQAVDLLEELARQGRSYGLHLVLASQSMTGIEALYGRAEAIFGQFPLRVALPGGAGVLDPLNDAAKALEIGTAVVNTAGGAAGANRVVRFPDAHAAAAELTALRHELWQARPAGSPPPTVFRGYETPRLTDDPTWAGLRPGDEPPLALVGRTVDVAGSSAGFRLDATPGRHLAVVGTSAAGVDVLRSATLSLARQHPRGTAHFLLAPLAPGTTDHADDLAMTLAAAGHPVRRLDAAALRAALAALADPDGRAAGGDANAEPGRLITSATTSPPDLAATVAGTGGGSPGASEGTGGRTYLVVFGMDAAAAALGAADPTTFRSGHDDLRAVLRHGAAYGVHLLGWWRGLRRLGEDLGGSQNRDDVACLVALNVPGADLGLHLGVHDLSYAPRDGRALLVDRHDQRTSLIVPFVHDGAERDGEQGVAAEAERRRALDTAADQLGRRLTAQGQRLDQLGQAIGVTPPAPAATPAAAVPVAAGGPALATPPPGSPSAVSGGGLEGAGDTSGGSPGTAGEGPSRPETRAGGPGGSAAAPGRPGVGAYPEGVVLPAPRPAEVDPAAELDAARQLADEADRHGRQAEVLAQHPALLPTWSPLARAFAVYTVCALAGSVLVLLMAVASEVQAIGLGAVLAVACTGVPVGSFVAGLLVLGRWGRPAIGGGAPPSRFVPLGFVICALLSPSLYCAYVLLFRLLR